MCEHTQTYDAVFADDGPIVAVRQCTECQWWTKVWGLEFEPPLPTPEQVLQDVANWRSVRLARERLLGLR